jgi:hypothetical protein
MKRVFSIATLAVMMAAFSSSAAMGQSQKEKNSNDWMKDLTSRITLNG